MSVMRPITVTVDAGDVKIKTNQFGSLEIAIDGQVINNVLRIVVVLALDCVPKIILTRKIQG